MPAIVVTDINNLFGILELSTKLSEHGIQHIQHIIGCKLDVKHPNKTNHLTNVLLCAKNKKGYKNLIQLVKSCFFNSTAEEYPEISLDTLGNFSEDIVLVTGRIYGSLRKILLNEDINGAKNYLEFFQTKFDIR